MIDSLARAIYHTLKAAWYWAFGELKIQCPKVIGPYRCVLNTGHDEPHKPFEFQE